MVGKNRSSTDCSECNLRRAEDEKLLDLLWTMAHSPDIPSEKVDQALASHVKILDYNCSQGNNQKKQWLNKCVAEIISPTNDWVVPALRLIRTICCLYEAGENRERITRWLIEERQLFTLVMTSLTTYMERVRALLKDSPELCPTDLMLDKRYPHPQQIAERLDFLKSLLKDAQLWLSADEAKQIWQCLSVNAAFPSDREECFRWFGKLMGDEPDLGPGIIKDFFKNNLLQLDPTLLTESGIKCFERFFKAVNSEADDENPIGKDYLWRVFLTYSEDVAFKAIELLKETDITKKLKFIGECCDKLKTHIDNIESLSKIIDEEDNAKDDRKVVTQRVIEEKKMSRLVRLLHDCTKEYNNSNTGEDLGSESGSSVSEEGILQNQ